MSLSPTTRHLCIHCEHIIPVDSLSQMLKLNTKFSYCKSNYSTTSINLSFLLKIKNKKTHKTIKAKSTATNYL